MRVIIAGGRDYNFTAMDEQALDRIHADTPISMVICGGASGADECGRLWAISRDIPHEVINAPWDDISDKPPHEIGWHPSGKPYWKQAGPFRNDLMAQKADVLIVFPGGRGTKSMLSIAKRYDIKVFDIKTLLEHQE